MMRRLLFLLVLGCKKTEQPLPSPVREVEEDFSKFEGSSWQEIYREEPQSFDAYVASEPNRPGGARKVFYIQPLGEMPENHREAVEAMREYAEVFFGMPARVCDPLPMFENGYVASHKQYNSTMIIGQLAERAPADAVVYVGITSQDLFAKGLNFVFGEGSLRDRTGVYSLVRYETEDRALFLRRALKLMAHEAGHIFSIHHCVTYACVMNGANNLSEDDSHPMHLCPIDLQKLQWAVGFDWVARYEKLRDFYRKHELKSEAWWTERHLKKLRP